MRIVRERRDTAIVTLVMAVILIAASMLILSFDREDLHLKRNHTKMVGQ